MTITRDTLLFFDASCLIAAAGNPNGGSGFLLSLAAKGYFRAAVSQPVLLETQRNIQKKFKNDVLNQFYRFLVIVPFLLAPIPPKSELEKLETLVSQKDTHVLAAAESVSAVFIITLDKPLEQAINQAKRQVQALTPGEFIKAILPEHEDFPKE